MSVPYGIIHHNNLVSRIQSKVNNVMLYCTSVFWKKYFLAYFRRLAISRAWSSFWASFKLNYMFCETTWLDREFGIPFYCSEHVRNFSSTFSSKKTTFKKGEDELSTGVTLHTKVSSFHAQRCVFQNYFSTSFYQDENAKTYWHGYLSVCLVTKTLDIQPAPQIIFVTFSGL